MKFSHKSKQLGLEYHEINMGMFDYQVKLVIGNHKKTIELMNWYLDDPSAWYDDGNEPKGQMFCHDIKYAPVIWLPHHPVTVANHATFAHEACHAVMRMFQWAGMPVDASTDEVFAHAVSHIIESFYRKMG